MPEDRPPKKQAGTSEAPWARGWDEVGAELGVDVEAGLSASEVQRRRHRFGPNRLRRAERENSWDILLRQFKSLVILILLAAAVLSFAFGRWVDGTAIGAAIVLNTLIGFVTELKAVRSMEALQQLGNVTAKVRRDGNVSEVPAHEIVRGDAVVFESGDLISADVRLVEAAKLFANESALTGESVPVAKQADPVDEEAPLAERACMLFKGAAITRGSGQGIVVATGMDTEIGHIASLAQEAEDETTPLERRLDRLGRRLIWITLALVALVVGSGVSAGRDAVLMIETGVALAVAAIPEGLPIVATVALARGMWRMARRNALVNRLAAVETLGSTNVICTDKTGTLTENRMAVNRIVLPTGTVEVTGEPLATDHEFRREGNRVDPSEDRLVRSALRAGVLCNNAELQENTNGTFDVVGDPMETALLVVGAAAGLRRPELLDETPEAREEAFESDTKMMATFHEQDGSFEVVVKGAPESVLPVCTHVAGEDEPDELDDAGCEQWFDGNDRLADDGFRVLALATKHTDSAEADPYRDLTLLGLAGLLDPPRGDVREAIDACQAAGIKVVMVTGDHGLTARNVALATGLVDDPDTEVVAADELDRIDESSDADRQRLTGAAIFARVSPEQKLALIRLHQEAGSVVAMTGDGVNDAPALKKADIGVAMGRRGTQVAREAADIVLTDDALSTIVTAVEQGRGIFSNIRKFIVYLLSGNVSEIMAVSAASLVGLPLPILPLQILFLNLVNDVFPALALGLGAGPDDVIRRSPRDKIESVLTRSHWGAIAGYGALIAATILLSLVLAIDWLGLPTDRAVSVSFLTLAFARLWHVFNMRESGSGLVRNDVTTNPAVWAALALCTGLLLAAAYLPTLANVLAVHAPDRSGWLLAMGLSFVPLAIGQCVKQLGGSGRPDRRNAT